MTDPIKVADVGDIDDEEAIAGTGAAPYLPASIAVRTHQVELRGDEIRLYPGVPVGHAVTGVTP